MADLTPIPNAAFPLDPPRGAEGSLWGSWYMTALADATPEMILQPSWWQRIAARFTPGDTVEVQSQSKTFHLKLLVRAVRPTSLDCVVLSEWRESMPAVMSSAGMRVCWGSRSWRIEMVASGEVVREGFQSRTEAAAVMVAMTETRPKRLEREVEEFKGKFEGQVRRTEQVLETANRNLIELAQANAIAQSETLAKYMLATSTGKSASGKDEVQVPIREDVSASPQP